MTKSVYDRLSKSSDKAKIVFANVYGETFETGKLVNLIPQKNKISTRWEVDESENIHPWTHAGLIINNNLVTVANIKPIQRTEYGYMDIEYER